VTLMAFELYTDGYIDEDILPTPPSQANPSQPTLYFEL
jgi:hypothetical protein